MEGEKWADNRISKTRESFGFSRPFDEVRPSSIFSPFRPLYITVRRLLKF